MTCEPLVRISRVTASKTNDTSNQTINDASPTLTTIHCYCAANVHGLVRTLLMAIVWVCTKFEYRMGTYKALITYNMYKICVCTKIQYIKNYVQIRVWISFIQVTGFQV